MKSREPRTKVYVPARMRGGSGWTDICILNLSPRGLMARTEAELKRGTYVEVRRGSLIIIGRVAWTQDGHFGLRSQNLIDIAAVVNEPRLSARPGTRSDPARPRERRAEPRSSAMEGFVAKAERSRNYASAFQAIAITSAGIVGCVTIVSVVARLLRNLNETVGAALNG